MNCQNGVSREPLRLSITGGKGVGKSLLLKIICIFLMKTMNLYSGLPDKSKILIPAPTGVAANNINGTTIISGLSIPPYVNGYTLSRLQFQKDQDYAICILKQQQFLLTKYQWFQIFVYFIYIKDYVKYLAAQKLHQLIMCLFLFQGICYSCHLLNFPKCLKDIIIHFENFSICGHYT